MKHGISANSSQHARHRIGLTARQLWQQQKILRRSAALFRLAVAVGLAAIVASEAASATALIGSRPEERERPSMIHLAVCRIRADAAMPGQVVPVEFQLVSTRAAVVNLAVTVVDSRSRTFNRVNLNEPRARLSAGGSTLFRRHFTMPATAASGQAQVFCGAWHGHLSLGFRRFPVSVRQPSSTTADPVDLLTAAASQRTERSFTITTQWRGTGPIGLGIYLRDAAGEHHLLHGVTLREVPSGARTDRVTIPTGAAGGAGVLRLEWRALAEATRPRGGARAWAILVPGPAPICKADSLSTRLRQCVAR